MDNNTHDKEPLHNIAEAHRPKIDKSAQNSDLSNMKVEEADKITTKQGCFKVLTESKIKQLQEEAINEVSSLLLIPKSDACLLLTHHGWSTIKVHESWFEDEPKAREMVGLLLNDDHMVNLFNSNTDLNLTCEICYEIVPCNKMKSVMCGHFYCTDCWAQYVDTKIQEGPNHCLNLRCPHPECAVAVDGNMIRQFASESNVNKYDHFLFRSLVETNKNIKWCPSPGCEFAIVFEPDGANRKYLEATCLCYHSFCWKCGEEAHKPLSCEAAREWITLNKTEFDSSLWIFENTKPCPGCNIPIEKDNGCMDMTCTLCSFWFCWLCLRHCNVCLNTYCPVHSIEETAPWLVTDQSEMNARNKKSKGYMEKYTHYYDRWASNEYSRKKAVETWMAVRTDKDDCIRRMCQSFKRERSEFEFLNVAWGVVIECRRILKWSYAYGFFIANDEEAKKEFFAYTQDVAENALEKLHEYAEKVLVILDEGKEPHKFEQFRWKLIDLTDVTKKFFENFVSALEKKVIDDVSVKKYSGVRRLRSSEVGESSKNAKRMAGNKNVVDWWRCDLCGSFNDPYSIECLCQVMNHDFID